VLACPPFLERFTVAFPAVMASPSFALFINIIFCFRLVVVTPAALPVCDTVKYLRLSDITHYFNPSVITYPFSGKKISHSGQTIVFLPLFSIVRFFGLSLKQLARSWCGTA
jgi:hypothetical protein